MSSSREWGERLKGVTRVSLIDHRWRPDDHWLVSGLVFEARDVVVNIDYQDDGRTLKVWVNDPEDDRPPSS